VAGPELQTTEGAAIFPALGLFTDLGLRLLRLMVGLAFAASGYRNRKQSRTARQKHRDVWLHRLSGHRRARGRFVPPQQLRAFAANFFDHNNIGESNLFLPLKGGAVGSCFRGKK
jgi:hypothetical protein